MKRTPFKKLAYLLFSVCLFLVLGEISVRVIGYQPGVFLSPQELEELWVDPTLDSLTLSPMMYPNRLGLLQFDLEALETEKEVSPLLAQIQSRFGNLILNQEGFRGREFLPDTTAKKRILFIGDSFVFGYDAQPLDSSFVDVFAELNPEWAVYNGGVGGIDMVGYEQIAKTYIPEIQPDLVVLCLYVNDGVFYPKTLTPFGYNDIYLTDGGVFFKHNYAYSEDSVAVFANEQEVYKSIQNQFTARQMPPGLTKFLLNSSALITLAYGPFFTPLSIQLDQQLYKNENYTPGYFKSIRSTCDEFQCQLLVTAIPDRSNVIPEENRANFSSMTGDSSVIHFAPGLTSEHYGDFPHVHFDNSGYAFYGKFLDSLVKSIYNSSQHPAHERDKPE